MVLHQSIHPESIKHLPKIREKVIACKKEYVEMREKFIRPYCVVFLDQTFLQMNKGKKIQLLPIHSAVHQYLKQCKFDYLYGDCPEIKEYEQGNIIPLMRFKGNIDTLENEVVEWVTNKILRFIPELENKLRRRIVQNIWEIVNNAIVHSDNFEGASACGQFYPAKGYFEIAFYDSGIGIANKIKSKIKLNQLNEDSDYIEWAMDRGNSTLDVPNAGLGLYILREFLKLNHGVFQIFSGNGYFGHTSNSVEEKKYIQNYFYGTLINIRIIFDQNIYSLKE